MCIYGMANHELFYTALTAPVPWTGTLSGGCILLCIYIDDIMCRVHYSGFYENTDSLASVSGLPRSVRMPLICIIKMRTERGRPGTEAIDSPRSMVVSVPGLPRSVLILIMCRRQTAVYKINITHIYIPACNSTL